MQLWIITFGATLAANIATVGFIAAAISLLHWVNKQQPNQQLTEWYWAVALGFMGAILLFCITVSRRVKAGVGPSIYWTWSLRILLAISILFALLFGLVLLGLAAGVK